MLNSDGSNVQPSHDCGKVIYRRVVSVATILIAGCWQPTPTLPRSAAPVASSPATELPVIPAAVEPSSSTIEPDERTVDGIRVIGTLTDDEVQSIRRVVQATPDEVDKRILQICLLTHAEVEVMTGESEGPLSGHGNLIILKKIGDKWAVTDTALWKS
ncbi:MAG: hypothetical protein JWP89_1944 [Schlesneria sp.]|nr:hypothetical protein [Schlesneria sp.]